MGCDPFGAFTEHRAFVSVGFLRRCSRAVVIFGPALGLARGFKINCALVVSCGSADLYHTHCWIDVVSTNGCLNCVIDDARGRHASLDLFFWIGRSPYPWIITIWYPWRVGHDAIVCTGGDLGCWCVNPGHG